MKSLKRLFKRSITSLVFLGLCLLFVYYIIHWLIVFISSIIADSINYIFS
jgi:hypothetical protein